jgi:hypothetical protein
MLKLLLNLWHARTRRLDVQLLWPSCKSQAPDIHHAKAAFACHAFNDPSWLALGHDEICRRIEELR